MDIFQINHFQKILNVFGEKHWNPLLLKKALMTTNLRLNLHVKIKKIITQYMDDNMSDC